MNSPTFVPNTVYRNYIRAPSEDVWNALTSAELTRQYFFGRAIELEPRVGGTFILRMPDGRIDVQGRVVEWDPPHRLSITWRVEWIEAMRELPECLVTYEIVRVGDAVRLTATESHQMPIDDKLLEGGRQGWPAILSSLKSLLETGTALDIKLEPPKEMMEALARQS